LVTAVGTRDDDNTRAKITGTTAQHDATSDIMGATSCDKENRTTIPEAGGRAAKYFKGTPNSRPRSPNSHSNAAASTLLCCAGRKHYEAGIPKRWNT
jgi:hypothetical protein